MIAAVFVFLGILLSPQVKAFLSQELFGYIGRVSFSVYVVHYLIMCSVVSWAFLQLQLRFSYDWACILAGVLYLTLTFVVAHLLTLYIDEPTTRLANAMSRLYRLSLPAKEGECVQRISPSDTSTL